jgi:hypothetical protein
MPRKCPIYKRYKGQKKGAKNRGIEFHFTFEDWVKWWEDNLGPSWVELRGNKGDQYCMARFEDKGSYVIGNVKCITMRQNRSENRAKRGHYSMGENNSQAKLTKEQVVYIKASGLRQVDLARKFDVCRDTIYRIRVGKTWK